MKTKKTFDCVEMKRRGAERIYNGCVVRPGQHQGRIRNQLHALLLQTASDVNTKKIRADILALERKTEGLLGENSRRVMQGGAVIERSALQGRNFSPY